MRVRKRALLTVCGGLAGLTAIAAAVGFSGYEPVVLWTFVVLSLLLLAAAFKRRFFKPLLIILVAFAFVSSGVRYFSADDYTFLRRALVKPVVSQNDFHALDENSSGELYAADLLKGKRVLMNYDSPLVFIPETFAESYCFEYQDHFQSVVAYGYDMIDEAVSSGKCEQADFTFLANILSLLCRAYNMSDVPEEPDWLNNPLSYGLVWTKGLEDAETVVLLTRGGEYDRFFLMSYEKYCEILNELQAA